MPKYSIPTGRFLTDANNVKHELYLDIDNKSIITIIVNIPDGYTSPFIEYLRETNENQLAFLKLKWNTDFKLTGKNKKIEDDQI